MPPRRLVYAFAVAPLSPGLVFAAITIAVFGGDLAFNNPPLIHAPIGPPLKTFLLMAAFLGYPVALTLGIAAYLVLRRLGQTDFALYVICGGLCGMAATLLVPLDRLLWAASAGWLLTPPSTAALQSAVPLLLRAICGGFGGWIFWEIVRPDAGAITSPQRALITEDHST